MTTDHPTLLALDFDGVLCNGLNEYFQTTYRVYQSIWSSDPELDWEDFRSEFYHLRPVIETGWEMPLLLRALVLKIDPERILQEWAGVLSELVAAEGLDRRALAVQLDQVRDQWIQSDLVGWLACHEFYPGVVERLRSWLTLGELVIYIITTKEGRFVQALLQGHDLNLPTAQIVGKESNTPKAQTLRQLLTHLQERTPDPEIWFVEDRLKTLRSVQREPDLASIQLFLAEWGYTTPSERQQAHQDPHIQVLTLDQFLAGFNWTQMPERKVMTPEAQG